MWADLVGDESYSWESFLPYFKKSLDFPPPDASKRAANATAEYDEANLGDGNGPLSVTFSNYAQSISSWVQKGLSEIGIKPVKGFTSGDIIGSAYVMQAIQATTQTRESSETALLQPALERSNLVIFHQSLAKKIVFDERNSATGVLIDTDGKKYTLSAKQEVILSAGAFRSPQLLMVSSVGPLETLQQHGISVIANRPGVGQNMWDHIFFGPSYRVNVVTGSSMGNAGYVAQAIEDYLERQAGILTNSGGDFLHGRSCLRKFDGLFPTIRLPRLINSLLTGRN
ncbi:hypothetical protein GJ744_001147 [Endocarpon pusillum]|uniref:glucose oxidase n=1 Tax=Endocarpon pusillum TaxID=364733 RepID=A0A8H7A9Y4_9EURO|nr:hypothetical protein GJ744_001147 [Endocarpon pusillum]